MVILPFLTSVKKGRITRPPTINRRLLSLKYFLEWGWRTKKIKYRFPLPKTVKQSQSIPKWLNRCQQNQLLRHIEQLGSKRDIAIVKILLNTGLRVSELCGLKWSDIIMSDRKGKLLVNAGKGSKYRDIPLNKDARLAFYNLDYTIHAGSDAFIFTGQRGALISRGVQLMTDTGAYSDIVFGLFRLLGYRFSPRLADLGDARFWRVDPLADYGKLNILAKHRANLERIIPHWDDVLRLVGSLKLGRVPATGIMRTLQVGDKPTRLAQAIAEIGRIDKTILYS